LTMTRTWSPAVARIVAELVCQAWDRN
jgi:hypothetical protein